MEKLLQYLIHENTVCLIEDYDENGNKETNVIDGDDQLVVVQPPLKIIHFTLQKMGFSLRGAIDGSRYLLGKEHYMLPLTINSALGIYLIPTKAYGRHDCCWLSLMHIQDIEPLDTHLTRVHMSYGHTIDLDMKANMFIQRLHKARKLRESVTRNTKSPLTFCLPPKAGYKIIEGDGEYFLKK